MKMFLTEKYYHVFQRLVHVLSRQEMIPLPDYFIEMFFQDGITVLFFK